MLPLFAHKYPGRQHLWAYPPEHCNHSVDCSCASTPVIPGSYGPARIACFRIRLPHDLPPCRPVLYWPSHLLRLDDHVASHHFDTRAPAAVALSEPSARHSWTRIDDGRRRVTVLP